MIWLGAYFIAVCVTAALTPLLIRFARHSGLMDLPDARKVHVHPTPRVGGVAIVIAVLAASLPLLPLVGPEHGWPHLFPRLWAVLACAVAVAVIGLVDDLVGLAAELKLVGLLVVA